MTPDSFRSLVAAFTQGLAGRALDATLAGWLNLEHGAGSGTFAAFDSACRAAVAAGWMCHRIDPGDPAGIRFGRVVKPGPQTHGFSVDVVEMNDCVGPHHEHPNGEIDLVMPLEGDARFDGQGAGWKVYGPGSAHRPTVTGGRALVLYLLPEGAIRFTSR